MRNVLKISCLLLILLGISPNSSAQDNVTTFGIQLRPIIPSESFNSGFASYSDENWNVDIGPKFGFNFGMVIRHGLTKHLSLETGINFATRNYRLDASFDEDVFTVNDFKLISYEIPLQGLVYIKMSEAWYVNAAIGVSMNMFPSNIETRDAHFHNFSVRRNWLQGAVLGNVGFEYRSEDKGYFYIGATLHRPFTPISYTRMQYNAFPNTIDGVVVMDLTGNYLTLDLRYFFPEDPEKRKKKN